MELSANLSLTPKGVEEVKLRVHKLGMKKRSVLILLDTPKSLAQIIDKSVFPETEIRGEIGALIGEGFIATDGAGAPRAETPRTAPPAAADTVIAVDDEIILSEAKFLLTDFVVDSFGTQSQAFVDAIRACKQVVDFRSCLGAIVATVEKRHPARLPALRQLVGEINDTA